MATPPKAIYRFNTILVKILTVYFAEIDTFILKFICNLKGSWIVKTIVRKKNKVEGLTLPDFKIYYGATVIKQFCTGIKTDK